jgi:hypothetical protein
MNDSDAIHVFVCGVADYARSLPLRSAVPFLRGALLLAGDREEVEPLRRVYTPLAHADDQLELIAGAQLRLPLDDKPPGLDGQHDGHKP